MKELIRNRETKSFLTADGGWTYDPHKGREIRGLAEAMELVRQLKLKNVEFYTSFMDELPTGEWDFGTPLTMTGHLGQD